MSRAGSKSKLSRAESRSNLKSKAAHRENTTEEEEEVEREVPQLAWRVLGEGEVRDLASLPVEDVARKLAAVLSLTQYEESLCEAAELDYFVAGYWFAREHQFTNEQTSAFFTLLHILLDNLKSKQLSLSESIRELQGMMAGVGLSRATALQCMSAEEAVLAVEYVSSSLFQHYRLFQALFSGTQGEQEIDSKVLVCVPPDPTSLSPPPLEEAVPLELYQRCLAPPTPQLDQEEKPSGGETDEPVVDKEGQPVVLHVTVEEVGSVMETLASETLASYQVQVSQKLKEKEQILQNRISKIEKTLT